MNQKFEKLDLLDIAPHLICAEDDLGLKPIHGKNFSGAYYEINDAQDDVAYRIVYKLVTANDNGFDDEEDF